MLRIIFIIYFIAFTVLAEAAIITASTNSGLWNSSATWDLNRIPANQDVVIIPAGISVRVNNNMYHGVPNYPRLEIKIYGTLQFVGTGQLNLECGSSLCTYDLGTIPSTGSNSNQITIGPGLAPWKGAAASITSGDCVYSSSCPLPVVLTKFEGISVDGNVELNWQVSSEIDFDKYELQRSQDGMTFETLYSIKGGSSNYSFRDLTSAKISYYQLKMIDEDGSIQQSKVIRVSASESTVSVFPNPCTESITIISESVASFQLMDSIGKVCKTGFLTGITTTLETDQLSAGIYWMLLQGESKQTSIRVVVQ
jgi:hypothetical protein